MSIEKFTPVELTVLKMRPAMFGPDTEVFATPITPRENMLRLYEGKTPLWAPFSSGEHNHIMVELDPENVARSPMTKGDRFDGWGVEWVFVEMAGGATVKPGKPMVTDINDWENQVKSIPDPDSWDWEGYAAKVKETLDPERTLYIGVGGCLFERLIALMDFSGAAMALIDDDEKDAVHRLFRRITDIHKKFYTNCKKYLNADIVNFNDDWGSQRSTFLSPAMFEEFIEPAYKKIYGFWKENGVEVIVHHSDSYAATLVPSMIRMGIDIWQGAVSDNNIPELLKKYGGQITIQGGLDNGKYDTPDWSHEKIRAGLIDLIEATDGAKYLIPAMTMGGPESTYPGEYEAVTEELIKLSGEYFK